MPKQRNFPILGIRLKPPKIGGPKRSGRMHVAIDPTKKAEFESIASVVILSPNASNSSNLLDSLIEGFLESPDVSRLPGIRRRTA